MAYEKLNLIDGQKWKAEHVEHIEDGILNVEKELDNYVEKEEGKGLSSNVTNMATMFVYVPKLTSLDLSGWDTSKVTTMNRMFDNSHIENLILGTNWASNSNVKTFDLQNCSALTHDSVLDVFNKLASRTNSPTLRLSSTSKGLMSDEEVAIATNKGWVVS